MGFLYTNGVSNTFTDVGVIGFLVPMDAPEMLFYLCPIHPNMAGPIRIISISRLAAD
jgi:hypothetical protein